MECSNFISDKYVILLTLKGLWHMYIINLDTYTSNIIKVFVLYARTSKNMYPVIL